MDETIWSVFDIMEFTDSKNIPSILIFIDFKKVFDTLEWYLVALKLLILVRTFKTGSKCFIKIFRVVL